MATRGYYSEVLLSSIVLFLGVFGGMLIESAFGVIDLPLWICLTAVVVISIILVLINRHQAKRQILESKQVTDEMEDAWRPGDSYHRYESFGRCLGESIEALILLYAETKSEAEASKFTSLAQALKIRLEDVLSTKDLPGRRAFIESIKCHDFKDFHEALGNRTLSVESWMKLIGAVIRSRDGLDALESEVNALARFLHEFLSTPLNESIPADCNASETSAEQIAIEWSNKTEHLIASRLESFLETTNPLNCTPKSLFEMWILRKLCLRLQRLSDESGELVHSSKESKAKSVTKQTEDERRQSINEQFSRFIGQLEAHQVEALEGSMNDLLARQSTTRETDAALKNLGDAARRYFVLTKGPSDSPETADTRAKELMAQIETRELRYLALSIVRSIVGDDKVVYEGEGYMTNTGNSSVDMVFVLGSRRIGLMTLASDPLLFDEYGMDEAGDDSFFTYLSGNIVKRIDEGRYGEVWLLAEQDPGDAMSPFFLQWKKFNNWLKENPGAGASVEMFKCFSGPNPKAIVDNMCKEFQTYPSLSN